MNITVLGGGNIGMCLIGEISRKPQFKVTIYASHPETFAEQITVIDEESGTNYISGKIRATYDLKEAVMDADVIICTYPAHMRKMIIAGITPFVKPMAYVGFFPGYGGAEFYCKELMQNGVTIFAVQKVPYVARTKERGKIAGLLSRKNVIYLGSIPNKNSCEIASLLEDMLSIKCEILPNYMCATLLPGNPLLHTSGSYVYLKDYNPGDYFSEQIYYYRSWNDECSKVLCEFSDEMMNICRSLPIDLSGVLSIQEYYESSTPQKLTKKFHSIPSFQPLLLPMIKTDKGYIPDFTSRYYTEDIPHGVCIIKALALIADVKTPTIDLILDWYRHVTGKEYFGQNGKFGKDICETSIPQQFGICTAEEIANFYLR